ncbi:hypothetical protein CVD28_18490 [Bacillus sp. M6-12]|uniref:hypothetical protein n=1 Tax=Bacillus sp. M6-12 TaxID=2054166 RepID=UPI000C762416|nr:hypothetical protein [Bacillus sp. M6-12]PLS16041.1 hypothetical protein CVD28_18490 [Bacillus sp. M6-12]
MKAFISYQLKNYIRSLTFIPPAAAFIIWVAILYAYKNVPILSSYGSSALVLYLIMAWITMGIFKLETETEKHLLLLHLKKKDRYLYGKWISSAIIIVPLFLLAHFLPIITVSYRGTLELEHHGLSLFSHLFMGLLGILAGSLFMGTKLAREKYVWPLAILFLSVSLAYEQLHEKLPAVFGWLLWALPPIRVHDRSSCQGRQLPAGCHFLYQCRNFRSIYSCSSFHNPNTILEKRTLNKLLTFLNKSI